MSISTTPLPGTEADPLYPDSDGKPLGETEWHVIAIFELYGALRRHFRGRRDIHVAADMFLYYEQGNPRACKAPDVMVSKGVRGNHMRRSFRVWEEQAVPTTVFEVTSKKSRREDATGKPQAYAQAGVVEYFIFDPLDEYLRPRLQGFRLGPNGYEPLIADEGRLLSQELGLHLAPEGALLRLIDASTGVALPNLDELENQAAEKIEAARAMKLAKRDVEKANERAAAESRRAEAEGRRAAALEEELKRLRQERGTINPG